MNHPQNATADRPHLRVALLGCALPEERFQEVTATDAGERMADQRFGLALIRALRANEADVLMISAATAMDYPHNSQVLFPPQQHEEGGTTFVEVGFVNVTLLKHLTRFASGVLQGIAAMRAHRSEVVVVHSLPSAFLATALVAKKLLAIPVVVVATDPPDMVHPFDSRLSVMLKRVDQRLIAWMLRRFDGIVGVTGELGRMLAPHAPQMVMEGIATPVVASGPHEGGAAHSGPPIALYAGKVWDEYGVDLLVEAQQMAGGAFDVEICGGGPDEARLREHTRDMPGVRVLGRLEADELAAAYRRATVLVNPRPLGRSDFDVTFPSKVLEYVATGKPVVSTRLRGIPGDYWDYVVPCDDNPASLADAIIEAAREDETVATARRAFVARGKTAPAQGRRLVKFLEGIVGER